jgi:hypothetical protein
MSLYSESHLLFPLEALSDLRSERDRAWLEMVAAVEGSRSDSLESAAMVLLLARLCGCSTCNSDSYRAITGCASCAKQALRRFRGEDGDLLTLFEGAKTEISSACN